MELRRVRRLPSERCRRCGFAAAAHTATRGGRRGATAGPCPATAASAAAERGSSSNRRRPRASSDSRWQPRASSGGGSGAAAAAVCAHWGAQADWRHITQGAGGCTVWATASDCCCCCAVEPTTSMTRLCHKLLLLPSTFQPPVLCSALMFSIGALPCVLSPLCRWASRERSS